MSSKDCTSPYTLSPLSVAEALLAGREAYWAKDRADEAADCPYSHGFHEHAAWHRGLRLARSLAEDQPYAQVQGPS